MKKLLPTILFTLLALSLHAQLRLAVEGHASISERLGIGTQNPLAELHIYDGNLAMEWPDQPIDQRKLYFMRTNIVNAANSSGYKFSWRNDDDSPRKDAIYFDRNGDVYFPGLSKVGIGTSDPSARLEVAGDTKIVGRLEVQRSATDESLFIGLEAGLNDDGGALEGDQTNSNIFIGARAGMSNTTGHQNTFLGRRAGYLNTTGSLNTFLGLSAGDSNTTGSWNTFIGWRAGVRNTTSLYNTFVGGEAGRFNTTGTSNTFLGYRPGYSNTSGNFNTFIGRGAGSANTTGSELTALGYDAGTIACCNLTDNAPINNAFTIGNRSLITASHSGVLGNLSLQKIGGYVNWGTASDGRMKRAVQEDVKGLDFILQLRPVSYQVDALKLDRFLRKGMDTVSSSKDRSDAEKAIDIQQRKTYEGYLREKSKIRYTGFIAQEVERAAAQADFAFSGVVKPEHDQDHYSLRDAEFVVPLVKATQEQQELIEKQEQENLAQEQKIEQLQTEVNELKAMVQQLLARQQNQTPVQSYELEPEQIARLTQNYPNPFHEDTLIDYYIPAGEQQARLEIHSMDGKLLETIPIQHSGQGRIHINAGSYPAGTYLYSLFLNEQVIETKQMILTPR